MASAWPVSCESCFCVIILACCSKYSLLFISVNLLIVRSFAKPNSLSTQRSESSLLLDLLEVLGAICWASEIVTTLSKSSIGLPSAAHSSLALFSYITCNRSSGIVSKS
uniref:Lactation elevated protein 1 n=1 Tax=Rhizophora mucronata TaxID=61149 RepID=A0A2P2K7Q6_RHIMU